MPNMDGFEASKRILDLQNQYAINDREQNYTKIVFLTSFTNQNLKKDANTTGVMDVYNKPLQSDQLREIMNKYFYN